MAGRYLRTKGSIKEILQDHCDVYNVDYSGKATEGFSMLPCGECASQRKHEECRHLKSCAYDLRTGALLNEFRERERV
jgi:hypothetical protein